MPPKRRGITTSKASISFEKRVNIRPWGVVSKNIIGNFKTFVNKIKCNIKAALKAPKCGIKLTPNEKKAGILKKISKIVYQKYFMFFAGNPINIEIKYKHQNKHVEKKTPDRYIIWMSKLP